MNRAAVHIVVCLAWIGAVSGETIRVPVDLPTIQAALNTIEAGDTILVAPGRYLEALTAPALEFFLIGERDSVTNDLPTITPQGLVNGDTFNCLLLPDSSYATIENIRFTNGLSNQEPGGMAIWSRAAFTMRNCVIDSARRGIYKPCCFDSAYIDLIACTFRNIVLHSIQCLSYSVHAQQCAFLDALGTHHCIVGDGSVFQNCTFDGSASFAAIVMNGDPMVLSNCTFGPDDGGESFLHFVQGLGNVFIQHNTFAGNSADVGIVRARGSVENSFLIAFNDFQDNVADEGGACIVVTSGDSYRPNRGGTISGNEFTNCFAGPFGANFIYCDADVLIQDNRFIESAEDPHSRPAILVFNGDNTELHNNDFIGTGYALYTSADSLLHAEDNWWGDNSGPYHEILNPSGRGDTIVGQPVSFVPWLIDTSSSVFTALVPSIHDLIAYPAPFNSSVSIVYTLSREQDVRLAIFDVLGRRVETLVDERQGIGVHSVVWTAEGVSSGVYFARLSSGEMSQTVKLMLMK